MTPRARKRLLDVLRVAICGAALWFVIRGVTLRDRVALRDDGPVLVGSVTEDGERIVVELSDGGTRVLTPAEIARDEDGALRITYGLKTAFSRSAKWLLLLAVLIHFPVGFLQGVRLRWLLDAQQIRLGYWDCVKLSFAGNFLNFAAPLGSTAGDVFKAYFVSLHTDRKTEAMTTIALDRILGLGTLVLVVAVMASLSPADGRLGQFRFYTLGLLGIGAAAIFAYLSPMLRRRLIPRRWLERLPMFEHLQRIDNTARGLAGHKTIVGMSVLITVVLQLVAMTAYFAVARALAMDAHAGNVLEYYACFFTGCVIQALPGPPQGLGTVELAYRLFFDPYGSPSQIVCMALVIRIVVLIVALPGALVTLTGSYRPRQNARSDDDTEQVRGEPAEKSRFDLAATDTPREA